VCENLREVRISDPRVLDVRSVHLGIENVIILKFTKWPVFNMLMFANGFDYRNFDFKRFNDTQKLT